MEFTWRYPRAIPLSHFNLVIRIRFLLIEKVYQTIIAFKFSGVKLFNSVSQVEKILLAENQLDKLIFISIFKIQIPESDSTFPCMCNSCSNIHVTLILFRKNVNLRVLFKYYNTIML